MGKSKTYIFKLKDGREVEHELTEDQAKDFRKGDDGVYWCFRPCKSCVFDSRDCMTSKGFNWKNIESITEKEETMKMLCIKEFKMESGEVAFKKGEAYECINDRFKNEYNDGCFHLLDRSAIEKHFVESFTREEAFKRMIDGEKIQRDMCIGEDYCEVSFNKETFTFEKSNDDRQIDEYFKGKDGYCVSLVKQKPKTEVVRFYQYVGRDSFISEDCKIDLHEEGEIQESNYTLTNDIKTGVYVDLEIDRAKMKVVKVVE